MTNSILHTVPAEPDDVEVLLKVNEDGVYGEVRDGGRTREEAGLVLGSVCRSSSSWRRSGEPKITGAGRTAWFRVARDDDA